METLIGLLPQSIRNIPTYMDFDGQKRAERYFQVIIGVFAVAGFIWGYICQQFSQTMYVLFVGLAVSCLIALPPWPIYRKKSVQWQKVKDSDDTGTTDKSKRTPKSKKKKDN